LTLIETKNEIKKEVAKKFKLKEKEIKFYQIPLEKKRMPFFKVEVENSTLKTLINGMNLK
jgi:hypothetical protein